MKLFFYTILVLPFFALSSASLYLYDIKDEPNSEEVEFDVPLQLESALGLFELAQNKDERAKQLQNIIDYAKNLSTAEIQQEYERLLEENEERAYELITNYTIAIASLLIINHQNPYSIRNIDAIGLALWRFIRIPYGIHQYWRQARNAGQRITYIGLMVNMYTNGIGSIMLGLISSIIGEEIFGLDRKTRKSLMKLALSAQILFDAYRDWPEDDLDKKTYEKFYETPRVIATFADGNKLSLHKSEDGPYVFAFSKPVSVERKKLKYTEVKCPICLEDSSNMKVAISLACTHTICCNDCLREPGKKSAFTKCYCAMPVDLLALVDSIKEQESNYSGE